MPQEQSAKKKKKFKQYTIGFFHIDIAEVHTEEGRLYLFVAIDRTSKYVFAELHEKSTRRVAANFLRKLVKSVPYKIHTVLTDNGMQFTELAKFRKNYKPLVLPDGLRIVHSFDLACEENNIEHRLTKVAHPWTNGQVERMNRTLKEATVKRYHYSSHQQLKAHLQTFLTAYNFAKRLKTLKGLTPHEYILQTWQKQPTLFTINPVHHNLGLNTGQVATRTREIIREICAANYVDVVSGSLSPDHLHLLLSVPPSISLSKVVQYIKGKSSRKLLQEFEILRKRYWGQHLWARGYFAVTVGNVNAEDVQRYIEDQEEHHKKDDFKISEF